MKQQFTNHLNALRTKPLDPAFSALSIVLLFTISIGGDSSFGSLPDQVPTYRIENNVDGLFIISMYGAPVLATAWILIALVRRYFKLAGVQLLGTLLLGALGYWLDTAEPFYLFWGINLSLLISPTFWFLHRILKKPNPC